MATLSVDTDTLADWHQVKHAVPADVTRIVSTLVALHSAELATDFYRAMMEDADATAFLSHDTVQLRLKPGIQRWMAALFGAPDGDLVAVAAMQRQVGEVHARAAIPVALVSRGMRHLKGRIHELLILSDLDREGLVRAAGYVGGMMDLAMSEMSSAYFRSHERGARTDETFRMVTAGQNAALERHKQLGALAEWENGILRALATGSTLGSTSTLRSSAFGLWVQHKAPLLFDESTELGRIIEQIAQMDATLLPLVVSARQPPGPSGGGGDAGSVLRDFLAELEETRYLVNTLFDRLVDMEVGRDVLTQLYNRRFLPTILRRELEVARRQQNSFAVLMIDVDHFKRVNDEHGHETGDRVLQHMATLLLAHGRASDFFFRYGGEEFLAVVNEVDEAQAMAVAEKIRTRVEQADIPLSDDRSLRITVSIGLAMHDGHPDYRHLVNRADEAVYMAKRAGRNQVVRAV